MRRSRSIAQPGVPNQRPILSRAPEPFAPRPPCLPFSLRLYTRIENGPRRAGVHAFNPAIARALGAHARQIRISPHEDNIATYIMLVNWTDQGVRTAKDTVNRARAFRETSSAMGVTVGTINWTLGAYDLVISFDSPDDETTTRLGLALAAQGNVRTATMRAFGEDEMMRITSGLK
jgi:uncharacterized protein with GYD domain